VPPPDRTSVSVRCAGQVVERVQCRARRIHYIGAATAAQFTVVVPVFNVIVAFATPVPPLTVGSSSLRVAQRHASVARCAA